MTVVGPYSVIVTHRTAETLFLAIPDDRSVSHYGFAKLVPSTWRKSPYLDAMELESLEVGKDYRRQGVASRLVRTAFAWSTENGHLMTMVTAYVLNTGAIAFYESLGMRPHYVTFDTFWHPPEEKSP